MDIGIILILNVMRLWAGLLLLVNGIILTKIAKLPKAIAASLMVIGMLLIVIVQ